MLYTTKKIERVRGFIFSVVQFFKLWIFSKSQSDEESTYNSKIGDEKAVDHSPKFRHGFISALSQKSISSIPDFLNLQEQPYPENRSFLIFLDEVISEFPDLLEPNGINAVKKWLEGKEKILMEPVGTVFHFSENISDNRQDILLARDTFEKDIDIQKHFREKYIKKKAWYDYHKAKGDIEKAQLASLTMELDKIFLSEEFESSVQLIESKPFDIYPLAILFVEKVNFIATNDTECFNPINEKAKAYLERRSTHLHLTLKKGDQEAMSSFYQEWIEEPLKSTDPDFPVFFAYTLRQISSRNLDFFLQYQLKICTHPFVKLLEGSIEDYPNLFEPKSIRRVRVWMESNAGKLANQRKQTEGWGQTVTPEGYYEIKGILSPKEINKRLMGFYERTELNKKKPFLSEKIAEKLSQQGLSYPVNQPAIKPFKLHFEHGGMTRFYGLVYEIYESHRPNTSTKSGYKKQFAKFLKHNFENFEEKSLETIMRDLRKNSK